MCVCACMFIHSAYFVIANFLFKDTWQIKLKNFPMITDKMKETRPLNLNWKMLK